MTNETVIYHSLAFIREILEEQRINNPRRCHIAPNGYVICIDNALDIYDKCMNDYTKGLMYGTKRITEGKTPVKAE